VPGIEPDLVPADAKTVALAREESANRRGGLDRGERGCPDLIEVASPKGGAHQDRP
jgi:hypothetical protein